MVMVVLGAAIVALAVLVWSLTRRLADTERKLADLTTLSRRLDDVRDDVTRGLALTRTARELWSALGRTPGFELELAVRI